MPGSTLASWLSKLFICRLYVSSAPRLILDFLHLASSDFSWLFLPAVAGILTGAGVASRCSGRFTDSAVLRAGFGIMLAAGVVNVGMNEVVHNPILPIAFLAFGIALSQPLLTLLGLETSEEKFSIQ